MSEIECCCACLGASAELVACLADTCEKCGVCKMCDKHCTCAPNKNTKKTKKRGELKAPLIQTDMTRFKAKKSTRKQSRKSTRKQSRKQSRKKTGKSTRKQTRKSAKTHYM